MSKTLGKIVTIKKGKKHNISENISEKSSRYIQIDDLRNNLNLKYTDDNFGLDAIPTDVVIAWDGANAGTIGYNINGKIGSTLARLRINKGVTIDSFFLGKFLESQFDYLRSTATGATIPHISRKALENIIIPNLNLNNQKRIVQVLSDCENLIVMRKESIGLLDDMVKSTFLEMFGDPVRNNMQWETVKVGEIINVGTGGTPSRKREAEFYNGNIPWAKTTEVNGDEIYQTLESITDLALKNSNCKIYPLNTILLAMYGQGKTRGSVGMLKIEAATNQACAALVPSNKINQIFLFELLKNSYQFLRSLARGGNQENLNLAIIRNVDLILPPNVLQEIFEDRVFQIKKLKQLYQSHLKELENLYARLSQDAFKGDLELSGVVLREEFLLNKQDEASTIKDEVEKPKEKLTRKEIKKLKKEAAKRRFKVDITNMTLADYFRVPKHLQETRDKIDFDFIGDDIFYQFALIRHFNIEECFTYQDILEKMHHYFYYTGDMDMDYETWKKVIFKFLEQEPPIIEQIFDEKESQIKLKLTNEAFKA